VVYFIRLFVLLPFVKLLSRFSPRIKKYSEGLFEQLIFGELIVISLEAYFEFIIAGYLNYLFQLNSTDGEVTAIYTSYYSLVMAIIILPSMMIFVINRPLSEIKEESFKKRWGSLYDGFRLHSKGQVAANLVFMLRRILFVLICFQLDTIPGVQVILVNLINLFASIYYGYFKPFESKLRTFLDFFNEFCLVVITWHMMFFTEYISDLQT
jgi:hypothetical protein